MPDTNTKSLDALWNEAPSKSIDSLWDNAPSKSVDDLWDAAPAEPSVVTESPEHPKLKQAAKNIGNVLIPSVMGAVEEAQIRSGTSGEAIGNRAMGILPRAYEAMNTPVEVLPTNTSAKTASAIAPALDPSGILSMALNSPLKDKAEAVSKTAVNSVTNLANFFTTPTGAATLGLGAAPAGLQKLVGGLFAAQGIKNAPEIAHKFAQAKTFQEQSDAVGEMVMALGMVFGGGGHAAGRPAAGGLPAGAVREPGLPQETADTLTTQQQQRILSQGQDAQGNLLPPATERAQSISASPQEITDLVQSREKLKSGFAEATPEDQAYRQSEIDRIDETLLKFDKDEVANVEKELRDTPTSSVPPEAPTTPPGSEPPPLPETVPSVDATKVEPVVQPDKMVAAAYQTPDGKVFTGIDHMDANEKAMEAGITVDDSMAGFVNKNGKFYNREDAYKVAKSQVIPEEDNFQPGKLHTGKMDSLPDLHDPQVAAYERIQQMRNQIEASSDTIMADAFETQATKAVDSALKSGKEISWTNIEKWGKAAGWKERAKAAESLDAPIGEEGTQTKADTIPAAAPAVENTELLGAMDKAIGGMSERDSAIMSGLKSGKTLTEIAEEVGLSPARVGQIVKENLPRLKKALEDMGFTKEDYVGGPGAMGPVEAMEMKLREVDTTALNRAETDAGRKERGLEPIPTAERVKREEFNTQVEDYAYEHPTAATELVSRVVDQGDKAISRLEAGVLLHERGRLMNERKAWQERLIETDPTKDSDVAARETAQKKLIEIEDQMGRVDEAARASLSEWSDVGRMAQERLRDDYTLSALERKLRAVKSNAPTPEGRRVAPEELESLKKQSKEILDAQNKAEEAVARDAEKVEDAEVTRIYEATINELGKSYLEKPAYGKEVLDIAKGIVERWKTDASSALERLKTRRYQSSGGISTAELKDLAIVARAYIGEFGLKGAELSARLAQDVGEWVTPHIKEIESAARKLINSEKTTDKVKEVTQGGIKPANTPVEAAAKAKAEAAAGEVLSGKTVVDTVKSVVASGVHGEGPVFKEAHRLLREAFPDLTEREMRKIFTKYGQKTYPSADAIKVEVAELKQIAKIREDINRETERAQGVIDPVTGKLIGAEKQGFQRPKATLPVRELMKERAELLKKRTPGDEEAGKLASRDEAKQTALKNRIEELDKQLKTGEKPVKGAPAPDSVKTEALRAELAAMREKLKEIEDAANPGKTAAEKQVEALTKTRDKLSETLSGKRPENAPKDWNPLSAAAEDLKAEITAMQELAAQMKRDAKPPTDPNAIKEKAQIRALEDAIRKYEDKIAAGNFSSPGRMHGPDTAKVAALRDIRDARRAAYKAAKDAGKPILTPEESYNVTRLKQIEKRMAELQAKLDAKDFTKTPKKAPPAMSKETLTAKAKFDTLKREFDLKLKEIELKQRPLWKKALGQLNQVRGIILGSDIGVLTRQGLFSWSRPATAIRATANALRAAMSPENMARWEVEAREREINGAPAAPIRKAAGLSMTDTMTHPEELVVARLLSRIPDFKVGRKTVRLSAVGKTLERFQTTFINSVRADLLDSAIEKGYSPEELKLRASFINSVTGRSNVKYVPQAMQAVLTSPRYEISRWETLAAPVKNIGALVKTGVSGEGVRGRFNRAAAANVRDMAVTAAGVFTLFKLAQTAGGYQVNWNPTSTDFLKMRKGDDVWDVSAGLAPRLRDIMRIFVAVTHPDYNNNIGKVLASAVLRTLSPALKTPIEQGSVALQKARGEKFPKLPFSGFKSDDEREGLITLAPLIVQSTLEALKKEGVGAAAWTAAREFVGSSANRYPKPKE